MGMQSGTNGRVVATVVAVMSISVMMGHLSGADWSEFRGPGMHGSYEGSGDYPVTWGEGENMEWKVEVPGNGWSSPSLSDGNIVLTSAVSLGEGYALTVFCFRESDGDDLWSRRVFHQSGDAPGIHRKNSHASPTPVIRDGRVYVHFGHQGTACLALKDGSVIWKNDKIQYKPVHGNGGSPVLVDGRLIFSCDGGSDPFVVALDAGSGDEVWRTPRTVNASKKFSFCTGLVTEIDGKRQVVLPGSDMVAGYDPQNGKELWKVEYSGYSVVPRPLHRLGLIFMSTGYDRASLLAINPSGSGNLGNKAIVWQSKRSIAKTPSFVEIDGLLYNLSDNGMLTCFEARTGKIVYDERLGGNYSSSLLYLNGNIYCTSEEGVTSIVKPGPEFKVLAKNDLGERTLASLAVGDNRIIYRSTSHLYSFKKK